MDEKLKILFIEDVPGDAELEWQELRKSKIGFEMLLVDNKKDFLKSLSSFKPDIIISDYVLPQFDGMTALLLRNEMTPATPFILVTGSMNEEVAVECMKAGADDYILKENLSRLGPAVLNSVNKIRLLREKEHAEKELRQSHNLNDSLLMTIPFGMDIVNEEGIILFQNDVFKRIFNDATLGQKCWEVYRDDKTQCSHCPLRRGIAVGETDAHESHGVLGNRIFEITHTGMMYKGEKAMLEIFLDITERKENEAELLMAKEKAENSDRLKTVFLHNISHEIRTPMNAIVGFSALLGEPDNDEETNKSYIEVITQSSNHLLEIITDIVDFSNIEANLVKVFKTEININLKIEALFGQMTPRANEKRLSLTYKTGLRDDEAFIMTDSTKLFQILSNLLNNAIKFTDKGAIKIDYKVKDGFIEFSVSDTGIGIPEEYHEKIFDRFYQVQNQVSRIYEGTGLGLSISKAYIELLGGKIWLNSVAGIGTTIFFTIPYEKSLLSEKISDKEMAPSCELWDKITILIAEDIESNFKLLKYLLADTKINILRAVNGKDAVEKCISEKNINIILMDIKMPVMDGFTAVKLIRETNPSIPIIAQTAYAVDREKAMDGGFSGYISKPFDKKTLINVLSEFI